jgi:hypothetical protein
LCFALFWAGHLFATDWPQWRGTNRAGAWTESGIVEKLPKTGLKVLWRAPRCSAEKGGRELWLLIGKPDAKSGVRWMKQLRGVHRRNSFAFRWRRIPTELTNVKNREWMALTHILPASQL